MPILLSIAHLLPAVLYLVAWRLEGRAARIVQACALAAHAFALWLEVPGSGWRLGFAAILSATLWVGVSVLWVEGLAERMRALGRLLLPVAAVASLLPLFFPGADISAQASRPLFVPHLLVGTLAYGVLALAALHAGLMMATERALHGGGALGGTGPLARFLDELPPLLVLERILFRFITVGFIFLTLTAVSGVLFSEEIFGRPFVADHKSVFSLIAWGVFGVLLAGRALRGWRGRTALRLTMWGFGFLLLAYVGSRFVLEVMLGRT